MRGSETCFQKILYENLISRKLQVPKKKKIALDNIARVED